MFLFTFTIPQYEKHTNFLRTRLDSFTRSKSEYFFVSLLNVNIKLDSPSSYLEAMSLLLWHEYL